MAVAKERRTYTLDEVLELVGHENDHNSVDVVSSESELEDDGVSATFPALSEGRESDVGENSDLSGDENDSSTEIEFDRRENIRNQRHERARQARQHTVNNRGAHRRGRRGRRARRVRGTHAARQPAEIQDGGQQYVWSEQASRRTLKLFNNCGGPTARGERRDKTALEYFELFFDQNVWNCL